jgi:hypothetical protein
MISDMVSHEITGVITAGAVMAMARAIGNRGKPVLLSIAQVMNTDTLTEHRVIARHDHPTPNLTISLRILVN